MSADEIRSLVKTASAKPSISLFLRCIRDHLSKGDANKHYPEAASRIASWLSVDVDCYPLASSRVGLREAQRMASVLSWKNPKQAYTNLESIVWGAITVASDDCDVCMGEERVFVHDENKGYIVAQCPLCLSTIELDGSSAGSPATIRPPTKEELLVAGLLADPSH